MRFHDIAFFCDKTKVPEVVVKTLDINESVLFRINGDITCHAQPSVLLFFNNDQDLINFKNNVLWAYEAYERGKHAA